MRFLILILLITLYFGLAAQHWEQAENKAKELNLTPLKYERDSIQYRFWMPEYVLSIYLDSLGKATGFVTFDCEEGIYSDEEPTNRKFVKNYNLKTIEATIIWS